MVTACIGATVRVGCGPPSAGELLFNLLWVPVARRLPRASFTFFFARVELMGLLPAVSLPTTSTPTVGGSTGGKEVASSIGRLRAVPVGPIVGELPRGLDPDPCFRGPRFGALAREAAVSDLPDLCCAATGTEAAAPLLVEAVVAFTGSGADSNSGSTAAAADGPLRDDAAEADGRCRRVCLRLR